jgi:hypothetical protein
VIVNKLEAPEDCDNQPGQFIRRASAFFKHIPAYSIENYYIEIGSAVNSAGVKST